MNAIERWNDGACRQLRNDGLDKLAKVIADETLENEVKFPFLLGPPALLCRAVA